MMFSFRKTFLVCLITQSLSLVTNAATQENTPQAENKESLVDKTHSVLSQSILLMTNRIDRFFGSTRADDEANGSTLRTNWQISKTEYSPNADGFNIRYNLRFPELQKKLRFNFNRKAKKAKKENVGDDKKNPQGVNSADNSNKSQKVRSKQLVDYTKYWNLRLEGGLSASLPLNPFINLRIWRPFSGDFWEFNPTHEFFTFWEQGFGTRHSFNVDFRLSPKLLLRFENTFQWTDESDEITSNHGPSLFLTLSARRAISFNAKAQGQSRPTYNISNYLLSSTYRQLLYKNWFFFELSPALNFPSDRGFERIASIFFKLEAVFGTI
jgi:hypothetical protein